MIVWTDGGLIKKLDKERAWFATLRMLLYVNDHVPGPSSVYSSFTQASFNGYAAVTLGYWADPVTVVSGLARMEELVHEFTWDATGSPQDVYGYYVVDADDNVQWAERYEFAPFVLSLTKRVFQVLPRMDAQSIP